MTPPTKAELREARIVERRFSHWIGREAVAGPVASILLDVLSVLRAFLDSGLAENEREVVRKVRHEIADAFPFGRDSIRSGLDAKADAWLAALAPIAEGGDKP